MDFVANFNLNKNEIEASFEVNQPAEFDAVLEINPSGANWGSITGNLSDQIDLQNAFDLKADKSEVEEDITTLDSKIDDVQSDLSGDISALTQTVEDNNTAINNRVDGVVDSFDADIEEINTNISNIQTTVSDNYTDLNTKIQNEATTRANSDSLLQGNINTLNTNLTAEINARTGADSNLQTQITENSTNINSLKTTINDYGDIVSYDAADFATAAQGEKANTALQPNDNITLLYNNAGYITNADLPSLEDLTTTEQLNAINSGATSTKINQIATNTSNISSLTTTVTNNYNTLDGRITSEVSALNTAIGTETTNRQNADNALQSQIDAIVSSSDVFDIVGTYAELQAYDISIVPVNDIIKVLVDSTHNNAATYYRCTETNNVKSWTYIGAEGAYYTKSEADNKFVEQTTTINNKPLSTNINLTASDVGALPSSTVIGSGVLTIQKNGSNVDTFNANATSNKSINITVPTKTSDLTNDSNFATVSQIPTNNNQLTNGAGYITSNALNGYATENFVTSQGYITGITSSDVTNALGYTPYNSTNPAGYTTNVGTVTSVNNTQPDANGNVTIPTGGTVDQTFNGTSTNAQSGVAIEGAGFLTGITSSDVTTALGYTPYNSTNPNGYTSNVGTVTSVNNTQPVNGNVTISIPDTSTLANKDLSNLSSTGEAKFQAPLVSGTNIKTVNSTSLLGSGNIAVQSVISDLAEIRLNASDGSRIYGQISNAGDIITGSSSLKVQMSDGSSIANYQLLDGTTGLIPDARISSNIARTSQIPSISGLANQDLSNLSSTGQKVIDGQWVGSRLELFSGAKSAGTTSYTAELTSYLPNDSYSYEVLLSTFINAKNNSFTSCTITTGVCTDVRLGDSRNDVSRYCTNTFTIIVDSTRSFSIAIGGALSDSNVTLIAYRRIGTNA